MIYAIIYFSVLLIILVFIGCVSECDDLGEIMLRAFFCGVLWPATLTVCIILGAVYLPIKVGKWLRGKIK